MGMLKQQLCNYLYSKDAVCENEVCKGGLEACREYLAHVKNLINSGGKIDKESVYLLYEHKKLMLERLRYLSSENVICISNQLINDYNDVLIDYTKLLNIAVKYKITGNTSLGNKIFELGN